MQTYLFTIHYTDINGYTYGNPTPPPPKKNCSKLSAQVFSFYFFLFLLALYNLKSTQST